LEKLDFMFVFVAISIQLYIIQRIHNSFK
jgi:hypothetical protein